MNDNDRPPVFYAEKYKQHARTIVRPDGTKAVEKRPIQKSVLAIDKDGNVCWFPLYTGPSQFDEDNHYRQTLLRSKQKQGWVFYGECPQNGGHEVQKHLPDSVRGRPACAKSIKGGPVTETNPCVCFGEIERIRKADTKIRMQAFEGQARTAAQHSAELAAEQLAETRRTNAMLAEARLLDAQAKAAAAAPIAPVSIAATLPDPMKEPKTK